MITRRKERINYQVLATTGEKVLSQEESISELNSLVENLSLDEKMTEAESEQLMIEEAILAEEIEDFLEEHEVNMVARNKDEFNIILEKIETLRSGYRRKHKELEVLLKGEYEEKYREKYQSNIADIKLFIKSIKNEKKAVTEEETTKKTEKEYRMIKFTKDEIIRLQKEIRSIICNDLTRESDNQIEKRKETIPQIEKSIAELSQKIERLIEIESDIKLTEITNTEYRELTAMKNNYLLSLHTEYDNREIEKKKSFKVSNLNIKLSKYKGYGSSTDIYTFQSNFQKVYGKTVPKHLQPDMLKNNFLEYPALSLVKNLEDIDAIWERLKNAYGDCKMLLDKKLSHLTKFENIGKLRDSAKVADALANLICTMQDLLSLAKEHKIENNLYYGNAIEKIYKLLGEQRLTRWLAVSCEFSWKEEELWKHLIDFIEKDVKVNQQKSLLNCYQDKKQTQNMNQHFFADNGNNNIPTNPLICHICGEADHVATSGPNNTKLIQYYMCKQFVDMNPLERFRELKKNGYCHQCLFPGAKQQSGKHKDGTCQRDFICPDASHSKYKNKKHVLVCNEHKHQEANIQLLQRYKERFILQQSQAPNFAKEIKLSYHSSSNTQNYDQKAIYMMQPIEVDGKHYTIFFDSGCGDFIARHDAIKNLGKRARKEYNGPVQIGGVGGNISQSPHGGYSITLPTSNGQDVMLSGICLDDVTQDFPQYPLLGKVQNDIHNAFKQSGGNPEILPKLPDYVGGKIDFMIGIKYLRYFPKPVFQLPSGLTIYQSQFTNHDGSLGVIGGPHEVFSEIEKYHCLSSRYNFLLHQQRLFQHGFQISTDAVTSMKNDFNYDIYEEKQFQQETTLNHNYLSRQINLFKEAELAGSQISYRCISCRNCSKCKSQNDDLISIKEEVEQAIIDDSITYDAESKSTIARLPIMHNPEIKLVNNKDKAMRILEQQMKKLVNNDKDKEEIIKSEMKLQDLGYVDYIKNLTPEEKIKLQESKIQNYIPWRVVWKENSISTPCRIVFDASLPTATGFSLNDILAKGRNNMNKLVEIFLRWRLHKVAFHTDVAKMYNAVKLDQDDWCYQRYLWKENLESLKPAEEKVIKTLIYGIKPSGNQAEKALRMVGNLSKKEYPNVCDVIENDIYVDDCLSGNINEKETLKLTDDLELVLNRGGFRLKGIAMSGHDPHENLSSDKKRISVAGMIWTPMDDELLFDIKQMNFSKKQRGRKTKLVSAIPEKLTRRQCTSKVAEIFDITGILTPITASMKLDLHKLVVERLDWDDRIPDNLRQLWINNLDMIKELRNLTYKRAVVPNDAKDLQNIELLCFGDASKSLACIAIYIRFHLKNDKYSSQLLFAKSRLIPEDMSQPRAELYAALVNVHSAEIVRRSLRKHTVTSYHFTDSQIVLHWICNDSRALKQWVRNRVIEIKRFTTSEEWHYIKTNDMIADLGTRSGCSIENINGDSAWINGFEWMKLPKEEFPSKSVNDIKLTNKDVETVQKETHEILTTAFHQRSYLSDQVKERYDFSKYVVDPNLIRYKKTLRILALVMKFIVCMKYRKVKKPTLSIEDHKQTTITITNEEIERAKTYFFQKATDEIKHFRKPSEYEHISYEKDGILLYKGRILESDSTTIVGRMTEAMRDLSSSSFCVPLVDKHSPIAYALVLEEHWYNTSVAHGGVESIWRQLLKTAYIKEGREVVKRVKASCARCRYLAKEKIKTAMAPISTCNNTVAPCFYFTQVDICGPFDSFSQHHKRTTVKIWLVVFCCIATSAISIKVMEDYSSTSFIMAFSRFACLYGYPKKMFSDEGSQLVKALNSMKLNFRNVQQQLSTKVEVEFQVCPVGGHNMNGKVERKIRQVKISLEKLINNERLSILQWETLVTDIANTINNLPLALGNITSDFETMDLLTPNRLILGRNNERSPVGQLFITSNNSKIIKLNQKIYDAWFENWLMNCVPKLMNQPKWFVSDENISKGDIVLFLKFDNPLCSTYQYGIVETVYHSRDGKIRKIDVKYKNSNENIFRTSHRAVREIVIIHHENEVGIYAELDKMNTKTI